MVLLVSSVHDATAAILAGAMNRAGIDCVRMNLDEDRIPIVTLESAGGLLNSCIVLEKRSIAAHEVSTIIYRKPVRPRFSDYCVAEEAFLAREVEAGLRAFLAACDCDWVNHPEAIRRANSKLINLHLAHGFGLRTPRTIVSSDSTRISTWMSNMPECVIKACSYGLLEGQDDHRMIFSQPLPDDFDPNHDIEPRVPVLIQERISEKIDVRVTIVGDAIFAAEVATESLDWRESPVNLDWRAIKLPSAISDKLLNLVRHLNLKFAAVDLARNAEGWWFLEVNPNGQWAWLEQEADLPIAQAFCALVGDSA